MLQSCLLLSLLPLLASAANGQQYYAPVDQSAASFSSWYQDYLEWKSTNSAALSLSNYDLDAVKTYRTNFVQPQVMMHDKFLYDREADEYTVDKFLQDVTSRYGGVDSVLIWPTYPNIGVDDRNQYDMHSSLPGGLKRLKKLVSDFHEANVKVLLPLNPWDQGTSSSGEADFEALIELIQAVGADGFNGDTMNGVNASYWDQAMSGAQGYPIMIEPETMANHNAFGPDDTDLETNLWSWGYWIYEQAPSVSSYKALTGGKHLTHICERWAMDHTDGIQHAFFNGAGFESWENVWGIWNGMTDRNAALLKRAAGVLRALGDLLQGGDPDFVPHIPVTPEKSLVYSTLFANATHKVFLLVNRNAFDAEPLELSLPCRFTDEHAHPTSNNYTKIEHANCYSFHGADDLESPEGNAGALGVSLQECTELCDDTDGCDAVVFGKNEGSCYRRSNLYTPLCDASADFDTYAKPSGTEKMFFADLYSGVELTGSAGPTCDTTTGVATLVSKIEAGGIGAILITTDPLDEFTTNFLGEMRVLSAVQLADLSNDWEPVSQSIISEQPARAKATAQRGETVTVPSASAFDFEVSGNCIEGDNLPDSVDVQYPWEDHPQRKHSRTLSIPSLVFDKFTVSNDEYSAFLDATGWSPATDQNFLRHWNDDGSVPEGWGSKPVIWVSRSDSSAYCSAVGARLPTSYEWQYAAQGTDGRRFPWGDKFDKAKVCEYTSGREMPAPCDRDAFPEGASPFGLEDMVGNVYQWTDAFEDAHTDRAVLRGGSRWRAAGSSWYLPQPSDLREHDTFLMMSDSMDRSAGIGFRCVSDN